MKRLISLATILFYFLASNTLAHTFAMNKIQVAETGCPFHAEMAHDMDMQHEVDPVDSKECYDSCLGTYDEVSSHDIALDITVRYDNLSELFSLTRDDLLPPLHTLDKSPPLSHGPPGARLAAKITKKLE